MHSFAALVQGKLHITLM